MECWRPWYLIGHKDAFSGSLYVQNEKRGEPNFWDLGSPGGQRGVEGLFFYKNAQKSSKLAKWSNFRLEIVMKFKFLSIL